MTRASKWWAAAPMVLLAGVVFAQEVPRFAVDADWPKPLPENWILGQIGGIAVGPDDHVWVYQRPRTLSDDERGAVANPPLSRCCAPAPPVIEFDAEGKVVGAWGGPGAGYDWPESEHGIGIDAQGNVWLAGNGKSDHQVLKFTRDGKFLMQIGRAGETGSSNTPELLGRPALPVVDDGAGELYIADGYKNRRVIVFDATSGKYKRHWGAYGNEPDDADPGAYDPKAPVAKQFRNPVHCVRIAKDGLVYVCDRVNDRYQIFRKDGRFVTRGPARHADTLHGLGVGHRFLRRSRPRSICTSPTAPTTRSTWYCGRTASASRASAAAAARSGSSTGSTRWPWTRKATSTRAKSIRASACRSFGG